MWNTENLQWPNSHLEIIFLGNYKCECLSVQYGASLPQGRLKHTNHLQIQNSSNSWFLIKCMSFMISVVMKKKNSACWATTSWYFYIIWFNTLCWYLKVYCMTGFLVPFCNIYFLFVISTSLLNIFS